MLLVIAQTLAQIIIGTVLVLAVILGVIQVLKLIDPNSRS